MRPDYDIQLDVISRGYDRKTCWVHARAGVVPNDPPAVVLTMQKLLLTGSDVFYALNETRTGDLGASWSAPVEHVDTLGRRQESDGVVVCICDFTPAWHAGTGKLLGTGHTVRYLGDEIVPDPRKIETAYSVYEADACTWSPWQTVEMPRGDACDDVGAGSTQRVDLPDGDMLLPVYGKQAHSPDAYYVTVTRCAFDGTKLRCLEVGDRLTQPEGRGFCEPSLTWYAGRFFLTIRNNDRGYVTRGPDGMHFEGPRPWTWDDGAELGTYNTQQHWVTHSDGLFLVYTRRGANNDHVFRHRAPLFMAQVDPDRLCVIRDTERILVPERGARLGNFGVVHVNMHETWVTVTEWMQAPAPDWHESTRCEKYGSDNTVFAARVIWNRPNRLVGSA